MRPLEDIFRETRTIAVVGLSSDPQRDSYRVARYLQQAGYRIVPVNPTVDEVLGEKSYSDLLAIPGPVDIVDVFRRPEFVPEIVEQAIRIGAKTIWMQIGITHEEAARRAEAAGLMVVQDRCTMVDHRRLAAAGKL